MQSLRKTISDNEQEMRPADSVIDSPGNMRSVSVNVSQIKNTAMATATQDSKTQARRNLKCRSMNSNI